MGLSHACLYAIDLCDKASKKTLQQKLRQKGKQRNIYTHIHTQFEKWLTVYSKQRIKHKLNNKKHGIDDDIIICRHIFQEHF